MADLESLKQKAFTVPQTSDYYETHMFYCIDYGFTFLISNF